MKPRGEYYINAYFDGEKFTYLLFDKTTDEFIASKKGKKVKTILKKLHEWKYIRACDKGYSYSNTTSFNYFFDKTII